MNTIVYAYCPCCGADTIIPIITATDYTVSGEKFQIWQCNACSMRFTQNIATQDYIGKYYQSENYISHTDTKKGFINGLYHIVRKRTLRHKQKLIEKFTGLNTGQLLDIGAGTGAFSNYMALAGWQVKALEPDEATRQKAFQLYGISLQNTSELFNLTTGSFDAVSMWHVLEHVHQLHEYMRQVSNILKSHGRAFIAVPNYTSFDAAYYQEYWAAYDVPRHLYHFSPESMKLLFSRHGMKLASIKPMWYDSFYVSLLSEQYKNGRAGYLMAFRNGLLSNLKAVFRPDKCSSLVYIAEKL